MPDRLSLAADLYTRRRCRCLPLHGVLISASLYFSDCSQKHIFPWYYFRTLERARERHGFIRRVLFEPLRVMHDGLSIFRALIRQINEICYRSAANGSFSTCISNLFFYILTGQTFNSYTLPSLKKSQMFCVV